VINIAEDCRLHLSWQEAGGPPVKPPARKGFGSLLIQATGEAETRIDFQPDGLRCLLDLAI
jgi:two-component sensor histidine kinase